MLKYDSTHGKFPGSVTHDGTKLMVDGQPVAVSGEKDPAAIPCALHSKTARRTPCPGTSPSTLGQALPDARISPRAHVQVGRGGR